MTDPLIDQIIKKLENINKWMVIVDVWTAAASDSIEELEDRVQKLEEYEARYREGRVEERLAALEQITNKSKQAPPPWFNQADPGTGFSYCPACGLRSLNGSVHYCPGKVYPPEGYGHGYVATTAAPVDGQRGAATVAGQASGPESAPVPRPPLGGQTEEEIRKAAHPGWFASGFTVLNVKKP